MWVGVGGQRSLVRSIPSWATGPGASAEHKRSVVGPSGDEFTGVFQVDVFDATGTLIVSDTGSVQGRRITVEPL